MIAAVHPPGALASGSGVWAPGVEAIVPATASYTAIDGVSCGSADSCSAVGFYFDGSFDRQGLLVNESSRNWADGVEASLPANASSVPSLSIGSLSCVSGGKCTAVGVYDDSSWNQQVLLLSESAGVWSRGVEAVLPPDAVDYFPPAPPPSVSCASPDNCAAAGVYIDRSNSPEGLLLSERAGVWSSGVEAWLPANAASGGSGFDFSMDSCDIHSPCVGIRSVSCASAGNCTAVGNYNDRSGDEEGLLLSERAGVWRRGVEASLPRPARGYHASGLSSVSCTSPGNCSAVGWYINNSNTSEEGLLLSETAGRWARGVEARLPPNAESVLYPGLSSVSCTSSGNCAAVGSYNNSSGDAEGVLLSESHGRWARGVEASLPANAGNNHLTGTANISSVSCAWAGTCAAVGYYNDTSGGEQGLLLSESSGRWSTGIEAVEPANAGSDAGGWLASVSCSSAGNCAAVGGSDNSGGGQGLLVTGALVSSPHNTTITRARVNRNRQKASFTFTAIGATRYQCALVKPQTKRRRHKNPKAVFYSCASHKAYRHLRHGRYTFEVRGENSAGAVDLNPAIERFRI